MRRFIQCLFYGGMMVLPNSNGHSAELMTRKSLMISPTLQGVAHPFDLRELSHRLTIYDHWVVERKEEISEEVALFLDGRQINVTLEIAVEEGQGDEKSMTPWSLDDVHISANPYLDEYVTLALKNGEKTLAENFCVLPHTMRACGTSFTHIPSEKCLWKFYWLGAHCSKPMGLLSKSIDDHGGAIASATALWGISEEPVSMQKVDSRGSTTDSSITTLFVSLVILILIGFVRFQRTR